MPAPRVYLAGPEVFLPDAPAVAAEKKRICAENGLEGVFPLDADLAWPEGMSAAGFAALIARSNEDLMRACDGLIANCTPFRGTGMDAGTAFEVGFMRALGRPVFGYTNAPGDYATRARAYRDGAPGFAFEGDPAALMPDTEIEDFGLPENLMIACAFAASGVDLVVPAADAPTAAVLFRDLAQFRRCVAEAAGVLTPSA